jgi:BMFP domain-containing protein YqiC
LGYPRARFFILARMIRFTHDPLAALEQRVARLEALLAERNAVTPVTHNTVTRNAGNAERQRRYRERLKNKNSPSV